MQKKYVAGFMFSPDFENVVLIEKNKPEWQKGKYNAIGGKIEDGESPHNAMVREFEEETGIVTQTIDWNWLCCIGDENYKVWFYWCSAENWESHLSTTDEEVFHLPVKDLHTVRHYLIENLAWLIPLAIDKAKCFSGKIATFQSEVV